MGTNAMAEVIDFMDRRGTKQVTYEHGGQKYTCAFDQNAPAGSQWVWFVDYVRTYRYMGSASTMEKAASDARRKIHSLNKRLLDEEEAR